MPNLLPLLSTASRHTASKAVPYTSFLPWICGWQMTISQLSLDNSTKFYKEEHGWKTLAIFCPFPIFTTSATRTGSTNAPKPSVRKALQPLYRSGNPAPPPPAFNICQSQAVFQTE